MTVELLIGTLTQGLIYALVAFGVYITYTILDFPDLSVDGSFPLGAAVTAVLLTHGCDPWLSLLAATGVGVLAGLFTGIIHVKFHIRNLLAGIITQTALFSINLKIAGSNLPVDRGTDTIFTSAPVMALLGNTSLSIRKLVVSAVLAVLVKLALDLYFRTKSGLLLRAVGDNSTLVTALSRDCGSVKILGLALSNGLVALAGSIVCHETRSFAATMGTGQVVFGLAAVIIGISLFRRLTFVRGTTAVLAGSILYKACIQAALSLGFDPSMMKFITAMLFLLVLIFSGRKGEEIIHA
ncbi:ABC transporter permease [Dysosmobacter sp.]|uniref:ABC transporter permease n=1 Tax=Dysosmobacter sp. TaxID=2591382 RepID=UPI002A85176C|nr:ABC transporter permease [Dysosmobacter sp.]MDY3282077.1 ABC transporter permease [Dysosmobacter sp.]